MRKDIYWLDESWPGKLAVASRPRGGEWLEGDIASWNRAGVNAVLSLLTPDEEKEMGLRAEAAAVRSRRMEFISFPIADLQIPKSEAKWADALEKVANVLSSGKNVLVHCRQGIGRSGMVAACLLVRNGMSPGAAIESVSAARGLPVPETPEQRDWIEHYAIARSVASPHSNGLYE